MVGLIVYLNPVAMRVGSLLCLILLFHRYNHVTPSGLVCGWLVLFSIILPSLRDFTAFSVFNSPANAFLKWIFPEN
jgi:hypothetical protein